MRRGQNSGLQERFAGHSDRALRRMVTRDAKDYTPEALAYANEELIRRNLEPGPEVAVSDRDERKTHMFSRIFSKPVLILIAIIVALTVRSVLILMPAPQGVRNPGAFAEDFFETETTEGFGSLPSVVSSYGSTASRSRLAQAIPTTEAEMSTADGIVYASLWVIKLLATGFWIATILLLFGAVLGLATPFISLFEYGKFDCDELKQTFPWLIGLAPLFAILALNLNLARVCCVDNATASEVVVSIGSKEVRVPPLHHVKLCVFSGIKHVSIRAADSEELLSSYRANLKNFLPLNIRDVVVFNVLRANRYSYESHTYERTYR